MDLIANYQSEERKKKQKMQPDFSVITSTFSCMLVL